MKTKIFSALLASALVFSSCGGAKKDTPVEQAQEVQQEVQKPDQGAASVALAKELNTTKTHDGKEIELVGSFDPAMKAVVAGGVLSAVFEVKGGGERESVSPVMVKFEQKANGLFFPVNFRQTDLEIYDNAGAKLAYDAKVIIKGTVKYTSKKATDFAYSINNVVITKAE